MRAVISFHAIDDGPPPLSLAPARFEMLIRELSLSDLPIMDLPKLLEPKTKKGIALTFDDGFLSVHSAALPILRDYDIPAHLFLTTSTVGENNSWDSQPAKTSRAAMLGWREVEALHRAGVRIEGHTADHPDLRRLDDAAIVDQMTMADELIERRLGRRPQYFAYPYGYHDARVRRIAGERYDGCVTTEFRTLGAHYEREAIPRLDSYYLQSQLLVRHLDSVPAGLYLSLRHLVRRVRQKS